VDQSLIIVLPVYNREGELRRSVREILELTPTFATRFAVVIVDDGSTDETYETACEIARTYPQVRVLRQSHRQGIGAALSAVGCKLSAEVLVVHDGLSNIDSEQLRMLLQGAGRRVAAPASGSAATQASGSRRLGSVRQVDQDLQRAHRSITGFQWVRLEQPIAACRRSRMPVLEEKDVFSENSQLDFPLPLFAGMAASASLA